MPIVLSPAGNMQALQCAVNNGASAIYLGLEQFNARQKADNFTIDNLSTVVDYCHLYGVKVYVAVNTSIKQKELDMACQLIDNVYLCNADGVILADIALFVYCEKYAKCQFEIIASTQMNVYDTYGARYVEELGATGVVLARETSEQNIQQIIDSTHLSVECFVHGAMCVCQSGQCLMSSIAGGNSGNRGLCAQPCRQYYSSYDDDMLLTEGYLLSPKDMYGVDAVHRLSNLGVDKFKIEGRNRRSQYSGLTSKVYNNILHNGTHTQQDLQHMTAMYNRGNYLTSQYLDGDNDDIIYTKAQGHIGLDIGYYDNGSVVTDSLVCKGDAYKIFHDGIEVANGIATANGTGRVKLSINGNPLRGDRVCVTSSISLINDIDNAKRVLPIILSISASAGEYMNVTAQCNDISVAVHSDVICQLASNKYNVEENITKQFYKTGDFPFTITHIVYQCEKIFLPISVINKLRRDVLTLLQNSIIESYNTMLNRNVVQSTLITFRARQGSANKIMAICDSVDSVKSALADSNIDVVVYYISDITINSINELARQINNQKVYIDITPFADMDFVYHCICNHTNIGIVANNIGAIQLAKDYGINYIAGSGLNIYNAVSIQYLTDGLHMYVYSNELTLDEIDSISTPHGFAYVYGKLVAMKTVHCPYKVSGYNCSNCQTANLHYLDVKGNRFDIVKRRHGKCIFDIVNGKQLFVAHKTTKAQNVSVQYDKAIVSHYHSINNGIKVSDVNIPDSYTKGRLFNKVK